MTKCTGNKIDCSSRNICRDPHTADRHKDAASVRKSPQYNPVDNCTKNNQILISFRKYICQITIFLWEQNVQIKQKHSIERLWKLKYQSYLTLYFYNLIIKICSTSNYYNVLLITCEIKEGGGWFTLKCWLVSSQLPKMHGSSSQKFRAQNLPTKPLIKLIILKPFMLI